MAAVNTYPVRVEGTLDPRQSRWLWLLKWLLVIPHIVVLIFLWIAYAFVTVVAFFAILVTGRYPRSLFGFNAGVLRWSWRVYFYSFGANATDRYPPFTLHDVPDYPARLDIAYPEQLSRGLAVVKWWLLAIPHYLVVGVFAGGGAWAARDEEGWRFAGGGLVALLVLIAAVALLFSGRYPQGIFDLVLGLDRWVLRVAAYASLMTDRYPPFRLDMGGSEEESEAAGQGIGLPPEPPAATVPPAPTRRLGPGRILAIVVGSIVGLIALGLIAAGTTAVVVDQTQRDADGFVMSPSGTFSTDTYALVSESVDVSLDVPEWVFANLLGDVRIRSESPASLFVGIAPAGEVATYLRGVGHAVVTDIDPDHEGYEVHAGGAPVAAPGTQTFWAASAEGVGEQQVTWEPRSGDWRVVVMNSDAASGLAPELSIGAELHALLWIGIGVLALGAAVALGAAMLIRLGFRRR